jgi:hypothetical protein
LSGSGAKDELKCFPQELVDVYYFLFDSGTFPYGWNTLSNNRYGTYAAGDCSTSGEEGTWTYAGAVRGELACPNNGINNYALVWNDPNTLIVAAIYAPSLQPTDVHSFWLKIGASIAVPRPS